MIPATPEPNDTPAPDTASCKTDTALPFGKALPWAGFITLLYLLNYMSRSTLSPLLVQVEEGLSIGHAAASSLLLMQSIGMSISLAASGFLLSRFKPRTMLAVPLALSGVVLLCMNMVEDLFSAQVLFLIFGFMSGGYFPAGMATLATLVFAKDWGKTVAIHELAPNVGFILIPLFAQLGLMFTNWQGVFALMGGLMIALGMAFAFLGRGGSTPTAALSFGECRSLLKNPASWTAALLLTVGMVGEFAIFSILQLFLVSDAGYSPERANVILSLSRVGAPVAVLAGGFAADNWNAGRVVRGCFAAHAVALLLMSLNPDTLHLAVMIGVFLQALSIAFMFPSIFKLFAAAFAQDEQPLLLSLAMPPAGLFSAGVAPFFLGLCGQYLSFAAGFCTIAVISGLTVLSVKFLENSSTKAYR